MMFDTISVGSATLDVFLKSEQFQLIDTHEKSFLAVEYGSKVDVDDFTMQSGGGATNTAVGFARVGLRSAVVAEIGTDLAAQAILHELQKELVDTSFLIQEKSEQTAVSALLINKQGGRSAVTARGAAKMLTLGDIPFERLQANWMHLSSIGNVDVVRALAQHCKKHRIRFSWNPGGAELSWMEKGELHLNEVYPTVFIVNEEESQRLVDAGYDLTTAGEVVIITNGRVGGKWYERGKWSSYEPLVTKAVQETGAGDAFATGVVVAYLHDRRTSEAIEWGKKSAASVVQHMGAKTGLLRSFA